ncbi:MAG: site-specific integrase [Clostridia bacterium]|nr:site-specific integrase [Clostridia bacterium]
MGNSKSIAFFERGSWYHRTKELQDDYTVKYGKIGGFKTQEEAEESYKIYQEKFIKELTANHLMIDNEVMLSDYLVYWFECIFKENQTDNGYIVGTAYAIYNFILPLLKMEDEKANIKLKLANTDYFNSILEELSKITKSAGNKCREVLNLAMKDAKLNNFILVNPIENTKKYSRQKPKIKILREEELKKLLKEAKTSNWYLEILLATFCGLRKGEIIGLKFSDFNIEKQIVKIDRELVTSPTLAENPDAIKVQVDKYELVEKPPKEDSYRTLRVPKVIINELNKRIEKLLKQKEIYIEFEDYNYISFQEKEGKVHRPGSLNTYLTRTCTKLNIPKISVHGLRHIFATILIEQGVPIIKIAALLGHSNPHTTFEIYCDVMEEREKILAFINNTFSSEKMEMGA